MKMDYPLPVQFGAVPFRRDPDGLRVLLVTSRETRRWILPKGWPIKNLKPHECAEREALEEAGVIGRVGKKPLGEYTYFKQLNAHFVLCAVRLYPLEVQRQAETWKEKGQRDLTWFTPEQAAQRVEEPELAKILKEIPAMIEKPA
jgi:8-oxo-dGTP pyrophosphatase MutT (NUDIX family)